MPEPKIILGLPGPAPASWRVAFTAFLASAKYAVQMQNAGGSWDNFNLLWIFALNEARKGNATHFAMLHADIVAAPGWLDVLHDECEALDADLISVAVPIKDDTDEGILSCGILNPDFHWSPLKRFTRAETFGFPETFSAADAGYPDHHLAHNNGLWIADLRKGLWREKNPDTSLKHCFDFRRAIVELPDGELKNLGESEDWRFSRAMAECGARSYITRKVTVGHLGSREFRNDHPGGAACDEPTRCYWEASAIADAPASDGGMSDEG